MERGDYVRYIGDLEEIAGLRGTVISRGTRYGREYDKVRFDKPFTVDGTGHEYTDCGCFAEELRLEKEQEGERA